MADDRGGVVMRTWSLESAFLKAYTTAALAVQGLIDAAHTVEQLTRPVRRDVRDCAEELADAEAERDVWDCRTNEELDELMRRHNDGLRAEASDDDTPHPTGGSIYDDESRYPPAPDWHNATDNLCVYARAEDLDPLAICGVCRPVRDIVEQMIEERFGSQADKADKLDAEMWRAYVRSQSTPAASAAGSSSLEACDDIPPSPSRERSRWDDCGGGPW